MKCLLQKRVCLRFAPHFDLVKLWTNHWGSNYVSQISGWIVTKIWANYEALSPLSWWCRSTQHGVQTTRTRGTSHYVALQTQAWTIASALHSKGWSLAHQHRPIPSISLSWSLAELQLKSSSPAFITNLQLKLCRQQWGFLNHLKLQETKYIVIFVLCHLLLCTLYLYLL